MQLHNMKRIDIRVWDKGNDLLDDLRKKRKFDS